MNIHREASGFGARLKDFIKKSGYSQKQFAASAGLSESRLSNYVTGARLPDIFTLRNMANRLGVTMDTLCSGGDSKPSVRRYLLTISGEGSVSIRPAD